MFASHIQICHPHLNICGAFSERQRDVLSGPHPRRPTTCHRVPRGGGARHPGARAAAALRSEAVPWAAPLCHPEGGGGVGRAGGRLRDHEEERPNPAGAPAPQHQRSGGDRRHHPGGHPRPPM